MRVECPNCGATGSYKGNREHYGKVRKIACPECSYQFSVVLYDQEETQQLMEDLSRAIDVAIAGSSLVQEAIEAINKKGHAITVFCVADLFIGAHGSPSPIVSQKTKTEFKIELGEPFQ